MSYLQKAKKGLAGIKNLSRKHLFIFSLILTLVLGLFFSAIALQLKSSGIKAAETLIYDDSLSSGWYNWSWSADIDFFSMSVVRSGNTSIAFTPQAWGGLSPAMANGNLDINPYTNLRFYINGGLVGGQRFTAELRSGSTTGPAIDINNYIEGGSVTAGSWRKVDIPLSVLKGNSLTSGSINRFALKESSGRTQSTVYIDDIGFYNNSPIATPTTLPTIIPTNTPVPTNIPPTPTLIPASKIYTDSLAPGWQDWSWSSTIKLSSPQYAYSGNKFIAFTTQPSGGFSPALANSSLDVSSYNVINFYIHGGKTGNQKFNFGLRKGGTLGPLVKLDDYIEGGSIVAGQWKKVSIPLAVLKGNILGNLIDRVALQEALGSSQPTVYIDDIEFLKDSNPIATPVPTRIPTLTTIPTVIVRPSPTSVINPSISPTSAPSATPTNTPTATPVVQACAVSSDSWDLPANPVAEGTMVNLKVSTSGNCDGKLVSYEIWAATGVGGIGDTRSRVTPASTSITNNQSASSWVAEYIQPSQAGLIQQVVSFFQNLITPAATTPVQYYFKAKVTDNNITITSPDPKLSVNPAITPPSGSVVIDAGNRIGTISPDFYSMNLTFYMNWNDSSYYQDENVRSKARALKLGTMRIPGGFEADYWRWWDGFASAWKDDLGNGHTATTYKQFADFIEASGAKAQAIVNYMTGTPLEAANWLEYANGVLPAGFQPGAGWTISSYAGNQQAPQYYFAWKRAAEGHPAPYNIEKWEIGNEIYYQLPNKYGAGGEYGTRYVSFYDSLHARATQVGSIPIKVAPILIYNDGGGASWNNAVLGAAKGKFEALLFHWYAYWDHEYTENDAAANTLIEKPDTFLKDQVNNLMASLLRDNLSPEKIAATEVWMTEVGPNSGWPSVWESFNPWTAVFAAHMMAEAQQLDKKIDVINWWNWSQGDNPYSAAMGTGSSFQASPAYWVYDIMTHYGRGGDKLYRVQNGASNLEVFAAGQNNGELVLLVLNKELSVSKAVNFTLNGYITNGNGELWSYGRNEIGWYNTTRTQVQNPPSHAVISGQLGQTFSLTFPPASVNVLLVHGANGQTSIQPTPTSVQPTPTPNRSVATPTPTSAPISGGMVPNPIVSRGKQVFTSSGDGGIAINGVYNDYGWRPGIPSSSNPAWLAIKVGTGPSRLLLNWFNEASYNYTDTGYGTPADYSIQTSSDSTNGRDGSWSTAVTITGNNVRNRGHSFDFTGKSWVRMYITKPVSSSWNNQYGIALDEIDVHDISNGVADTWFFMGDSLTANDNRGNQPDFAANIHGFNSNYTPAELNGGIGGETSWNGVQHIDTWLSLNPDVKYWAINYGANDSVNNTSDTTNFRNNMQTLINKVKAAGKVPVIARIHYVKDGNHNNISAFNSVIDDLVRSNNLIPGPDLYSWFYSHQSEISSDGLHPTATGSVSINRLWAESMRGLYTSTSAVSTNTSSGTSSGGGLSIQSVWQTITNTFDGVKSLYTQPQP